MLDTITRTLSSIESRASFASRGTAATADLDLKVEGVGAIRLPVSAAQARKLCKIARPARFGWREETLTDEAVRDTWEIARSRVKIDQRRWKKTLEPRLQAIRVALGLPADGRLEAKLHKLLMYEPGQHFVSHQDSEKADDMVGTLVVVLPSQYRGGTVEIERRDEKITYRRLGRGAKELTFIAFYADCHHRVRPIKEGHRIVLVYNLFFRGAGPVTAAAHDGPAIATLAQQIHTLFTTEPATSGGSTLEAPGPTEKLVYLLDHDYTQKSLGWARLKNADSLRAAALREVAARLECEIYLALADVRELWECEDDEPGWGYRGRYGRRYRHYYDDDNDDDEDEGEESYELTYLIENDVELRYWIDASGKPLPSVPCHVDDDEVCFTRPSNDMEPFESHHEGWMGNYGNTAERWYHRAAVVMWPRSRSFEIRARVAPAWAVDEVDRLIKAKALCEARDRVQSLLPFWSRAASEDTRRQFLAKTLRVATTLEQPELAAGLLSPFSLARFGNREAPRLAALVELYGLAWGQELLSGWEGDRRRYLDDGFDDWLATMPDFCRALCAGEAALARDLARWLIARQWSRIEQDCVGHLGDPENPYAAKQLTRSCTNALHVLESCAAVGCDDTRDEVLAFLCAPETQLTLESLLPMLRAARERHRPASLKALGLGALLDHCRQRASEQLDRPPRGAGDWSMHVAMRCACDLCDTLGQFLASRDEVRLEWPLAKARRAHVHRQIDGYHLPVAHTTRRRGSPYTLVLEKREELFARDAQARKALKRDLAWLERQRSRII